MVPVHPSRTFVRIVVVCLLAGAIPGEARAQYREEGGDRILEAGDDPNTADYNVTQALRRRGFALYALADAAGAGMATGDFSYNVTSFSPCDAPLTGFCRWSLHPQRNPAVATFQFFEVLYYAATPPSEWAKIRAVAPSVSNAVGGGYTALMNFALFRRQYEWGPRDGTLGSLFSGVTSTDDRSCRDHTGFDNGSYPVGIPLLAFADCLETWPDGGWRGDRGIPESAYASEFATRGAAFAFDYWRVPDSLRLADPFLGTFRTTYGESSDHYREILAEYGAVIPGGRGAPMWGGYPLGLVWRFEVFSFLEPGLTGVVFWRGTVINRSEDVYGTGIDYDSLYLGFQEGTGGSGAGGMGRYSNYYLPHLSTALFHQGNTQGPGGPCDDGSRIPSGAVSCANPQSLGRGYGNGGNAFIVLKSPIGDLRNKLFSRRPNGQPCQTGLDLFCSPGHPLAGDTITFNHGHICGFGGCWVSTHNHSDRRSFGMISSRADIVMDGRDPGSLSGSEAFRTFRNFGYPLERGVFNRWVPGREGPPAAQWDYNHDGVPDTLWYDTCHVNGCVETDWDTLPGGQVNSYGNVGGVVAAGPFALAAGDSTSWFVAFVGQRDSASTWAAITAATQAYLTFFPRANPPPAPSVAATQLSEADTERPVPRLLTLLLDTRAETWVDSFLLRQADALESAPGGTIPGSLVALNPWLPTALRERARDNLEAIEIYKSCDGGRTFTADADCVGDPTIGTHGEPIGSGWQAYAAFLASDVAGDFPNAFTDNAITPGRTYRYVIVAKSRGATFAVQTPDGIEEQQFAPSLRSAFPGGGLSPSFVDVYVPASGQAGSSAATVTMTVQPTDVTVPFTLTTTGSPLGGRYRALFGNRITVERDSVLSRREAVGTRVTVERTVLDALSGSTVPVTSEVFERDGGDVFVIDQAWAGNAAALNVNGDTATVIDQYVGLGFVIVHDSVGPVFGSFRLSGAEATPAAFLGTAFDGGVYAFADAVVTGQYDPGGAVHLRGPGSRALRGATGDTVPRATADSFMVGWRPQNSSRTGAGGGVYRVRWTDEAFGLPGGVVLNFSSPGATGNELRTALRSREAGTVGSTDPASLALLGLTPGDVVATRMPFRVVNETFNRPVDIVMRRRVADSLLLGTGRDTMRVAVPEDEWLPGDILYFIEDVEEDSTTFGAVVLDAAGLPIRVIRRQITFIEAVLGCNRPRPPACNPVTGRGGTGYVPTSPGDEFIFHYYTPFTPDARYAFEIAGPVTGAEITSIGEDDLAPIRVVPNPFVITSAYQTRYDDPRVLLTNVPPAGTLRIYTVSGQFVQQVVWVPADLLGAGDLHVRLVNRWEESLAAGLYIWVITAPSRPADPSSAPVRARGKFVIIR